MSYKDEKDLDSAIKHLDSLLSDDKRLKNCKCRQEHEQLRGWLDELRQLRTFIDILAEKSRLADRPPPEKGPLGLVMQAIPDSPLSEPYFEGSENGEN